jgi:hypothetical protein
VSVFILPPVLYSLIPVLSSLPCLRLYHGTFLFLNLIQEDAHHIIHHASIMHARPDGVSSSIHLCSVPTPHGYMDSHHSQAVSTKLVTFFQSQSQQHDGLIRSLRERDGKGLRLYLALEMEATTAEQAAQVPSYQVKVMKICHAKSLYADRLFDCSDTLLPLVKVKFCRSNNLPLNHLLVREISQNGFIFLDEQYHFLAYKDLGSEFAYFFPQTRSPYHNSFSCWQSVGDFVKLPHVPVLGLRLGLLVSGACAGFSRAGISNSSSNGSSSGGIAMQVVEDIRGGGDGDVATGG